MTTPRAGVTEALSRDEMSRRLAHWYEAWNRHDLDGVLALLHPDVRFEHWDGRTLTGRAALRLAWAAWFAGGGFLFREQETFIDQDAQKALFRWILRWNLPGNGSREEEREGVDVLHFRDGLIVKKLTFSKPALREA